MFGTDRDVGSECPIFLATLTQYREVACSEGRGCQRDHGVVAKLSFKVLRSALLCLRRLKKAWYEKDEMKISQDVRVGGRA